MKGSVKVFAILVTALVFASCKTNVEQEKLYEIKIDINADINSGIDNELMNAYEKETGLYSRTANPEAPATVYYKVTASQTGHADVESVWEGGSKYSIRLAEGTWNLVAKGYSTETSGVFSTQIFQSDTISLTVDDLLENSTANTAFRIVVYPVLKADEGLVNESTAGTVQLPFSIAADSGIVSATASWQGGSQDFTFGANETEKVLWMGAAANTAVTTGAHSVAFSFYKNDNAGNPYLCYYFTETVNVFANLKTTKWVRASEKASYMDADGNILITSALVAAFEKSTLYVDGNSGSDTASGSFFSPFQTIQKAVDVILKMNTGAATEAYSIFVKSNISDSSTTSYAAANNQALINIAPSNSLNLSMIAYGTGVKFINANRTSTATGRVMYIGEKVNLLLENIALTGGYLASGNGAGIDVEGALSVKGGIAVYGNTSAGVNNNVYLPAKADNTQKTITIAGALSTVSVTENETTVAKKAGIKAVVVPAYDTPTVAFTTGFTSSSNSSTPSSFFTSDDNYAVGLAASEAVIATTKLTFGTEIMKNVTLAVTGSTTISQSTGGIITITAASGGIDVTSSITEWIISVTNGGGNVTTVAATEIGNDVAVSINENQIIFHKGLPKGTYQVQVTAYYSVAGQTTGAKDGLTFDVEIN